MTSDIYASTSKCEKIFQITIWGRICGDHNRLRRGKFFFKNPPLVTKCADWFLKSLYTSYFNYRLCGPRIGIYFLIFLSCNVCVSLLKNLEIIGEIGLFFFYGKIFNVLFSFTLIRPHPLFSPVLSQKSYQTKIFPYIWTWTPFPVCLMQCASWQ